MRRTGRWLFVALAAASPACSGQQGGGTDPAVEQGRRVYLSVCVACHHGNPARDGSVGPAIAGSSRELVEAMVLRGEYPPGYTPKRTSDAMPPYPQLADDIDDLTAYLASAAEGRARSEP